MDFCGILITTIKLNMKYNVFYHDDVEKPKKKKKTSIIMILFCWQCRIEHHDIVCQSWNNVLMGGWISS